MKKKNEKSGKTAVYSEKAKSFAKFLNEKMSQHEISVADLSEELTIARKTIYRYKNADNPPTREIEKDIRSFFQKLDHKMEIKEGMRYADENDLSEEDLEMLLYELNREELEDKFEESIRNILEKDVIQIARGIGFYSHQTQEYIRDHFEVFCLIDPNELELVKRLHQMDPENQQKAFAYLENVPVDIGMLESDESSMPEKMFLYLRLIRAEDGVRKNKFGKIREGSKGFVTKELYEKLYEEVDGLYRVGIRIPADILGRIKTMLDFIKEDWYLLFLYERLTRSDSCKKNCGMFELDGRRMGESEYMFMHYLKVLGQ